MNVLCMLLSNQSDNKLSYCIVGAGYEMKSSESDPIERHEYISRTLNSMVAITSNNGSIPASSNGKLIRTGIRSLWGDSGDGDGDFRRASLRFLGTGQVFRDLAIISKLSSSSSENEVSI